MTRPRPVPPAAPAHATSEAASGQAFYKVLEGVGSSAERSVMFEDSMKNIRACKELGIGTVLLTGVGSGDDAAKGAGSKLGDLPEADDPAVDVAMGVCGNLREAVPSLWQMRFNKKPAQKI